MLGTTKSAVHTSCGCKQIVCQQLGLSHEDVHLSLLLKVSLSVFPFYFTQQWKVLQENSHGLESWIFISTLFFDSLGAILLLLTLNNICKVQNNEIIFPFLCGKKHKRNSPYHLSTGKSPFIVYFEPKLFLFQFLNSKLIYRFNFIPLSNAEKIMSYSSLYTQMYHRNEHIVSIP